MSRGEKLGEEVGNESSWCTWSVVYFVIWGRQIEFLNCEPSSGVKLPRFPPTTHDRTYRFLQKNKRQLVVSSSRDYFRRLIT